METSSVRKRWLRWALPAALGLVLAGPGPKWLALAAIDEYRTEISPRKGFHCAYAALYGGPTCSAYGRRVIREFGLLRGGRLLARRFHECREASEILSAAKGRDGDRPGRRDARIAPAAS